MIIDLDCSVGATSRIQWAETTAPLNISAHVLEAGVAAKGLGTLLVAENGYLGTTLP